MTTSSESTEPPIAGPRSGCFGLVVNADKPGARALAAEIISHLTDYGADFRLDEAAARLLKSHLPPSSWAEMSRDCGLIIVLGGDGTLLRTARMLGKHGRDVPPLAGINTGHLGFLITASIEDKARFLKTLCDRTWTVSRRSQLEIDCPGPDGRRISLQALNEVTVTRGSIARSIQVEALINGQWLNRYSGDGLIVATATGSTAYSLSAGGPIVSPDSPVFVVTPICAHALSNRTLVVADTSTLELLPVTGAASEILLNIDGGDPIRLPPRQSVIIRRADQDIPLVQLPGHQFSTVLRQKLGWSGSRI